MLVWLPWCRSGASCRALALCDWALGQPQTLPAGVLRWWGGGVGQRQRQQTGCQGQAGQADRDHAQAATQTLPVVIMLHLVRAVAVEGSVQAHVGVGSRACCHSAFACAPRGQHSVWRGVSGREAAGPGKNFGAGTTLSSRACQHRACPLQLANKRSGTPWVWAHVLALRPEARDATTTFRQRCICSCSIAVSCCGLVAVRRGFAASSGCKKVGLRRFLASALARKRHPKAGSGMAIAFESTNSQDPLKGMLIRHAPLTGFKVQA